MELAKTTSPRSRASRCRRVVLTVHSLKAEADRILLVASISVVGRVVAHIIGNAHTRALKAERLPVVVNVYTLSPVIVGLDLREGDGGRVKIVELSND